MPTRLVPSVMISGCTRKTPTPMPLASPISTAGTSAMRIATAGSWLTTCVAMMKAPIVATVLTERSMPPVSMVMVWQPARMASGIANLTVLAIQRSLTMPGRRICRITTSATSRMISGTSGWSRMNCRMRRPRETGRAVLTLSLMANASSWR